MTGYTSSAYKDEEYHHNDAPAAFDRIWIRLNTTPQIKLILVQEWRSLTWKLSFGNCFDILMLHRNFHASSGTFSAFSSRFLTLTKNTYVFVFVNKGVTLKIVAAISGVPNLWQEIKIQITHISIWWAFHLERHRDPCESNNEYGYVWKKRVWQSCKYLLDVAVARHIVVHLYSDLKWINYTQSPK